jgi:quinol-cytochrome oxidoreductase complex cytochrome b subunit
MIVVSIHHLRVVLTGAYARHRRLNYLIGVGMFVLVCCWISLATFCAGTRASAGR